MEGNIAEEATKAASTPATFLADQNSPMQGEFAMKHEAGDEKDQVLAAVQLGLEMEEREIREQIIASEMFSHQELHSEFGMELMMEKKIMGTSESSDDEFGDKFSMISHPVAGVDDIQQINPNPHKNNVFGDGQKMQIHDVAMGKWPFDRDPKLVAAQIAGKPKADLSREEVLSKAMPVTAISGMKRKGEALLVGDEERTSIARTDLQKKKWYCSLCEVSATSAGGFNLHVHGKKHKAKQAKLKSCEPASENSVQPMEKEKSQVQPLEEEKHQVQPMEEEKRQVQPMEEEKSQVQPMEEEKSQVQPMEEEKSQVQPAEEEKRRIQPLEEEKHQAQPMEGEKRQVQPMDEKKSQIQQTEQKKRRIQPTEEDISQVEPVEREKIQATKKWECSLCQLSLTSETLLRSHVQGKKHKAKAAKLGVDQGITEAKDKSENAKKWYCSLCEVSAASEKNLNDHLQGKKHKAKAELLNQDADNVDSSSNEKDLNDPKIVQEKSLEGDEGLKNEQEIVKKAGFEVDTINNEKKKETSYRESTETRELEKSEQEMGRAVVKLWHCKTCNEETYDEASMDTHRKSSKHLNLLKKCGGGLIVVSNVLEEAAEEEKDFQDAALDVENENESGNIVEEAAEEKKDSQDEALDDIKIDNVLKEVAEEKKDCQDEALDDIEIGNVLKEAAEEKKDSQDETLDIEIEIGNVMEEASEEKKDCFINLS